MTREEAIEFVKEAFIAWESEYRLPHEDWTETYKARDMAIEALQGDMYCPNCGVRLVPENEYLEPTQTHGRLIDADALKKKAQECATEAWKMNLTARIEAVINQFIDWIDNAPTVQADRPHGEWIEREDWNGDSYYDCSVCGESFVLCDGTPSMNLYHYCPNCGADMRKEAEVVHKPDYSYEAGMARRLREETLKNKLQELAQCDDYEMAHRKADELLCDFITKLGYGEVAQKFDAVPKWYA